MKTTLVALDTPDGAMDAWRRTLDWLKRRLA